MKLVSTWTLQMATFALLGSLAGRLFEQHRQDQRPEDHECPPGELVDECEAALTGAQECCTELAQCQAAK